MFASVVAVAAAAAAVVRVTVFVVENAPVRGLSGSRGVCT